jgi:uncharacterized protein (DUF2252 family)
MNKEMSSTQNTSLVVNSKQQLIDDVQRWVILESKLKEVNVKVKQMRDLKNNLTKNITSYMSSNNINNNIEISDGELRFYEKKEYSALTYNYIQKCLHEIIADETQVEYIIKYIKDNREQTTSTDIRRFYKKE